MQDSEFHSCVDLSTLIQRSMRINGRLTCLRLERIYWTILDEIAKRQQQSTAKLLSDIEILVSLQRKEIKNFSGFIRVLCVRSLMKNYSLEALICSSSI